jgi:hypothetical protein
VPWVPPGGDPRDPPKGSGRVSQGFPHGVPKGVRGVSGDEGCVWVCVGGGYLGVPRHATGCESEATTAVAKAKLPRRPVAKLP